jgi:hypothetical protein
MSIENLSLPKLSLRQNNFLLPNSLRACIVGKSGCGKTNLLMNLLLNSYGDEDFLDFDNLFIFAKSLHQQEYKFLFECFKKGLNKNDILRLIRNEQTSENNKHDINIEFYDDSSLVPDPSELDKTKKNLIIFDDVILEKQNKIEQYYTRGRHNNVDCIYISQNYIKLPRQTVRENANFFILFPQNDITLENFYRDHCTDLNKNLFKNMCKEIWKDPYSFVTIDMTRNKNNGKYRKMLNEFFTE